MTFMWISTLCYLYNIITSTESCCHKISDKKPCAMKLGKDKFFTKGKFSFVKINDQDSKTVNTPFNMIQQRGVVEKHIFY